MSINFDDVQVGGTLRVGTGVCPAVKDGDEGINGAVYAEGPVVFGTQQAFPEEQATLMVARTENKDPDCNPADRSLWVKGNQRLEGDDGTDHALNVSGGNSVDTVYIDGDMYVTGKVDCLYKGRLLARFDEADKKPKPFDMVHPSRGDGHRLRYACIEGPEVGIYYRGRVKNEKIIKLPNYWKDLVHINSISVQLQPIGSHQDVIVKRWDDETIYLQSNGGIPIDCFFHVYAERKDVNKLITEYVGDSWEDYPDPEYDDPKYGGQNIVTG